jgi:glutamine---fructose-6-phosphate transaminase (isomerizing)
MNDPLTNNAYVNDILHQPDAIRESVAAWTGQSFDEIRRIADQLSTHSFQHVVLTGMGASYYALHPLLLALTDHGLHAEMFETSELIHFAPGLLSPDTLIVAVSQSGQSVEMLQLLEMAKGKTSLLGVTNTPDSPLALNSDATLLTHAGSEVTVSCKSYVAALAALSVLGDLLSGRKPRETFSALGVTVNAMAQYLSKWETHVEVARQQMEDIRHLVVTGRGKSLAAAFTGGLILKESAHFPGEGMSSAAFRHGPFEMVSPAMFVLVLAGLGPTRQLNAKLVADIRKAGGHAELISTSDESRDPFSLPAVPDVGLSILEIIPIQMVSIALAILNDHVPGQFEHCTKITATA